jgi:hypothetical protein
VIVRSVLDSGWTDFVLTVGWVGFVITIAARRPLLARARGRRRR